MRGVGAVCLCVCSSLGKVVSMEEEEALPVEGGR